MSDDKKPQLGWASWAIIVFVMAMLVMLLGPIVIVYWQWAMN